MLNALLSFLLTGLILSLLLQDFVIDVIIPNTMVWFYINQAKPFILFLALGIVFVVFLRRAVTKQIFLTKNMEESRMNQIQILESVKKELCFFRHQPDKPFDFLSVGVYEIFGYQRDDFKVNFRKYGYGFLYDTVKDWFNESQENMIVSPEYEHPCYTSDGKKKHIQLRFSPFFDDHGTITHIEGVIRDITRIKEAEDKLAEKELMYHTLFEANNEAVVILKADKFIDCNRKVSELFEATIEEIIMHTPYSYRFSPSTQPDGRSSRDKALEKIRLALSGHPQVFAWQHLKSSGQPIMVEVSLKRFNEGGEFYLYGILRELDAEVLAQHNLKTQRENITHIIHNSPFAICSFNSNKEITEANTPFVGLTGKENPVHKKAEVVFSEECLLNCFTQCCKGEKATYSGSYDSAKGSIFVQASFIPAFTSLQEPDGGIVIIEELTELEKVKEQYAECQKGLMDILLNAREILYKVNCRTGKYEYMSHSLTEVLGYLPEEIYIMEPEAIKDLLHPEDREKSNVIIARLISPEPGKEVKRVIDYRIRHKNGSYRWFSDKYTVLFDDKGQPEYISGNIIDITTFKEAEDLLRTAAHSENKDNEQ